MGLYEFLAEFIKPLKIPLFKTKINSLYLEMGNKNYPVRSKEMFEHYYQSLSKMYKNPDTFDGLLYIMYKIRNKTMGSNNASKGVIEPLYIGIHKNVPRKMSDLNKTPRWDDSGHIGGIAGVLKQIRIENGLSKSQGEISNENGVLKFRSGPHYGKWVSKIFEQPVDPFQPRLKTQIYIVIIPWEKKRRDNNALKGLPLTVAEYFFIALWNSVNQDKLLNETGIQRGDRIKVKSELENVENVDLSDFLKSGLEGLKTWWKSFLIRNLVKDNGLLLTDNFTRAGIKDIPLFQVNDKNEVKIDFMGKTAKHKRLIRSSEMESFYQNLMDELKGPLNNPELSNSHDGLIYLMYTYDSDDFIPLYIGKTERAGRKNPISVNITSYGKFGRWGHTYSYHIGDLSYAFFKSIEEDLTPNKYADYNLGAKSKWVESLFGKKPSTSAELMFPVFFYAFPWARHCNTLLKGLRFSTAELERILVGLGSLFYPDQILNKEFLLKK